MPVGAASVTEAIRAGSEIFHALRKKLSDAGYSTNVGDEGGFAPNLASADAALGFVMQAIEAAGYHPGDDVVLALDPAASEFYRDGAYHVDGKTLDAAALVGYWRDLVDRYPIASIEDGMAEDDWDGWVMLTRELGAQDPAGRRRRFRHQPRSAARGHRARRRQRALSQGQSDRDPLGDARSGRNRPARRLGHGILAPLGRDRGHHDRRSGGRRQQRPDQDRIAVALGSDRQIQPADPNRGSSSAAPRFMPAARFLRATRPHHAGVDELARRCSSCAMMIMRGLRRRARVIVGPVVGIALTGYFGYNLVEGDRGFIAWMQLTRQIAAENTRLDQLRAERAGAQAERLRADARPSRPRSPR